MFDIKYVNDIFFMASCPRSTKRPSPKSGYMAKENTTAVRRDSIIYLINSILFLTKQNIMHIDRNSNIRNIEK